METSRLKCDQTFIEHAGYMLMNCYNSFSPAEFRKNLYKCIKSAILSQTSLKRCGSEELYGKW